MTRGRLSILALVAAGSLAAAGCLTASKQSRLQTDMGQVREQVFDMQRDTASILMRLEAIEESLKQQDNASPVRFADLESLIRSLTDEVRALGARIDDNTSRMTALSRDVVAAREQYRALEARLAAALATRVRPAAPRLPGIPGEDNPDADPDPNSLTGSGQFPSSTSPADTGAGPPGGESFDPASPAGNGSTGTGPAAGGESPPASTPAAGGQEAPGAAALGSAQPSEMLDEAAAEEAYRRAYNDYTRGDFENALGGFQEFLRRFPTSPLAGRAQYFIGESHFSQQRYTEAAEAFTLTIENHPGSDKTAAAYLKKGLSLLALKQTARGVIQLQHVIETFPRSEEARIAAERLRQLGLRDH